MQYDPTTECWLWTAAQDGRGYGQIHIDGMPEKAYRVAYRLFVGPIEGGLHIDHLCRVRPCVNPAHLEMVTLAENNKRQVHHNALKTHCRNGHPYDAENTRYASYGYGRVCRICRAESTRTYRKRLADG